MARLCYVLLLIAVSCDRSYAALSAKAQDSKQKVLSDGSEKVAAVKLGAPPSSEAELNAELNELRVEQGAQAAVTVSTPATTPTTAATTPTTAAPIPNAKLTGTVTLNSFDNFAYINLAKRTDRRKRIEEMLTNYSVDPSKVHRVEALPTPNLGAKGCAFSHL